jgi:hypothetical protein
VGFITLLFTYLQEHGYSMQEAMLPNLAMTVSQLMCLCVTSSFGGSIGTMQKYVFGSFMFVSAYAFLGPLFLVVGHSSAYIGCILWGVAFAFFFPASVTIVSSRVGEKHQAKCQATVSWCSKVGCAVGAPIWNLAMFDATATGFQTTRPAIASLVLSLVTTALAFYMWYWEDMYPPVLKAKSLEDETARAKSLEGEFSGLLRKSPPEERASYNTVSNAASLLASR